MGESQRATLIFLSIYDSDGYKYYSQVVTGNSGPLEDYQTPIWFYPCSFFFAELMNIKFISHFFYMHYWIGISLVLQCIIDAIFWIKFGIWLITVLKSGILTRGDEGAIQNGLLAYFSGFVKRVQVYFSLYCVWWLLPSFLTGVLLMGRITLFSVQNLYPVLFCITRLLSPDFSDRRLGYN